VIVAHRSMAAVDVYLTGIDSPVHMPCGRSRRVAILPMRIPLPLPLPLPYCHTAVLALHIQLGTATYRHLVRLLSSFLELLKVGRERAVRAGSGGYRSAVRCSGVSLGIACNNPSVASSYGGVWWLGVCDLDEVRLTGGNSSFRAIEVS
jgi:hypothetical protein